MQAGIGPDDVHVLYCETEALDDEAVLAASAILSPDERARAGRLHFSRDRRDYTAAHTLVRRTLSAFDGRPPDRLEFGAGAHGKPVFLGPDRQPARWSFSLSHTHGLVACAVTAGRDVGIDVECLDRAVDVAGVASRFFSPAEVAQLDRCGDAARHGRFIELWTLKEALLKGLGLGLSFPVDQVAFDIEADGRIVLDAPAAVDPQAWRFALGRPSTRHRLALAVRLPAGSPGRIRFSRADDSMSPGVGA